MHIVNLSIDRSVKGARTKYLKLGSASSRAKCEIGRRDNTCSVKSIVYITFCCFLIGGAAKSHLRAPAAKKDNMRSPKSFFFRARNEDRFIIPIFNRPPNHRDRRRCAIVVVAPFQNQVSFSPVLHSCCSVDYHRRSCATPLP